jgi:riboflavin kinase/FMN adenylyltransferase
MPDGAGSPIRLVLGVDQLAAEGERLLFTVGVFDGLHRGHRYLLGRLRRAARRLDAHPAVVTFDAHPDAVVRGHAPPLLLDPEERLGRLARAGISTVVVQHFDEALRRTPYDAFVAALAARANLAGFVMTPEAAFGHERRGTPEALAALGRLRDFTVVVVEPYELDGGPVRSNRIRGLVETGDLAEARRLLGRRVTVVGRPVSSVDGLQEVRPTVPMAMPPDGAYRAVGCAPWTAFGPGDGRSAPFRAIVDAGRLLVPERVAQRHPGGLRVALA